MKALYSKNDEEFIYELEAFLCKARSVLDTMLEDYMGISKKEKLRPYSFEEKAKELQISKHLEFIKP
ncbi:hypothetical protein [Thermococcus litoralis]|uniref:hypothetical protein n=1 Tax=Thermococcus litoralis TaxID=2265 RepID=UPI000B3615B8|nr:hypothetical protein [Thermococcus litoralis]